MHIKSIPVKIAAAIAPLALSAAIMAPTASAAVPPAPAQGTLGTPVQLEFIGSALVFLPTVLDAQEA